MPAAFDRSGRRKCPGTKFTAPASPIFWRMKIIGYICTPFRTPKRDSETLRCDGRAVRQRSAKPSTAVRFRFAPRRYPAIRRMAGYLFHGPSRAEKGNRQKQQKRKGRARHGARTPAYRDGDTSATPARHGENPETGRRGTDSIRQTCRETAGAKSRRHASVPALPTYESRSAAAVCQPHTAASRSSTCTTEASFNITHRSPSSR